jgi:dephospho-CoA kinase
MDPLRRTFGLTGGAASGKSTVARFFQELGAKVVDADEIGHALLASPLPTYQEIVTHFGQDILDTSGEIDRTCLARIVFANPRRLSELNAILHPRIIERTAELASQFRAENPRAAIIVDAALIYEVGCADRFAKILVAWCQPEQQLERLVRKLGISRAEAEQRIATQIPAEEKRRRADYVIDCSGAKEETRKQVEALYPILKALAIP